MTSFPFSLLVAVSQLDPLTSQFSNLLIYKVISLDPLSLNKDRVKVF